MFDWVCFAALLTFLLSLDLLVFHRKAHAPSLAESAGWSLFWCSIALAFNALVWWWRGGDAAAQFLAGYLVEKSLSMDNIFVFAVLFRFFRVELKYQYRVLFWGILGAVVLRLVFIVAGVELIRRFDWTLSLFGAFLVYTALKLMFARGDEVDPENNFVLRLARRLLPVTRKDHGPRFFGREEGRLCITPLLLVLLVVESTDVLFAVDSVPAIFGITRDPFVLFTSNVFAILGLRALYFLLAGVIDMFRYLSYGLGAVLAFVGLKMIAEYWIGGEHGHLVSPWVSLAVIATLLSSAIGASLVAKWRESRLSNLSMGLGEPALLPRAGSEPAGGRLPLPDEYSLFPSVPMKETHA